TIAVVWSYIGEMDVVVKADGVVRPNQRISTINNMVGGKVKEVYLEGGKQVTKGDILYIIDDADLQIKKEFLQEEINRKTIELENVNKLKRSILEDTNYFSSAKKEEELYYYKYLKFQADKNHSRENVNLIIANIENTKDTTTNLQTLSNAIKTNINLFEDLENEYYAKYIDYNLKLKGLKDTLYQRQKEYQIQEKMYQAEAVSKVDYEKAEDALEQAELELEKFQNSIRLDLKLNLEENQRRLRELKIQLQQTAPGTTEALEAYPNIAVDHFKNENLISVNDHIKNLQVEIRQLENNLQTVKLDIESSIVRTPIDGYINIIQDINKGDSIQGGTVATIIPDNDTNYKVQIYAPNEEIANIKVGDKVKYNFLALPYKEYGELTGKITKIAIDTKVTNEGNTSYYLVEADIKNRPLISYKGEEAEIKVGMVCEVRVVTKTKKILHHLLEKIDLRL
ncbi:HlyD family secretion protein, partial [Clostridium aceticum]